MCRAMNNSCARVHPPTWTSGVAPQTLRAQLLPWNESGLKEFWLNRSPRAATALTPTAGRPQKCRACLQHTGGEAAGAVTPPFAHPPVRMRRTGTRRSELGRRGVPARTSAAATRGHSVTRNGFVSSRSRVFPLHHRLPDDCCVFHASLKEAAQKKKTKNNTTTQHEDSFLSAATKRRGKKKNRHTWTNPFVIL